MAISMAVSVSSCCICTETLVDVQASNTLESNAPKIKAMFEIATWALLIMYGHNNVWSGKWLSKDDIGQT